MSSPVTISKAEQFFFKVKQVDVLRHLFWTLIWCLSVGALLLYLYAYSIKTGGLLGLTLRIGSLALITGAACFMAGFVTGNLFGMPKYKPDEEDRYELSNKLVEVATWLTNIIVGVGLVELKQIPSFIKRVSYYLLRASGSGNTIQSSTTDEAPFFSAIIIFFFLFGFYFGYNWMRLFLSKEYKKADDTLNNKAAEDPQNQSNDAAQKLVDLTAKADKDGSVAPPDLKAISDAISESQPIDSETARRVLNSVASVAQVTSLQTLISSARQKMRDGKLLTPDDPQKGQWGGSPMANGRVMSAEVKQKGMFGGLLNNVLFDVTITVTAAEGSPAITDSTLIMALHDSFPSSIKAVDVVDGKAILALVAYGAFTVGCFVDGGATQLELDLATVPGAPDVFKTR